MRIAILGLIGLLLLGVFGCEDKPSASPTTSPTQASSAMKVRCPLCVNHEIEVTDETPRAEHEGQTYYFCSQSCHDRFLSDPAKFIARAKARAAAATQPAAR